MLLNFNPILITIPIHLPQQTIEQSIYVATFYVPLLLDENKNCYIFQGLQEVFYIFQGFQDFFWSEKILSDVRLCISVGWPPSHMFSHFRFCQFFLFLLQRQQELFML